MLDTFGHVLAWLGFVILGVSSIRELGKNHRDSQAFIRRQKENEDLLQRQRAERRNK